MRRRVTGRVRELAGVGIAALAVLLGACTGTAPPPAAAPPSAPSASGPSAAPAAPPAALGSPQVIAPGRPGEPARVLPGAAGPTAPETVTPADTAFVAAMVPHHEQALLMAGLAPTRAADPRVRAMADRIGGVQGAEIAMMRGWLIRQGVGAGAPGAGGMGGMAGMRGMATPLQLEALAAANGPAFDRMFLDLMIAHHVGALDMARREQVDGRDVTALQIADDVVSTQSVDIARMREMYPA